MVINPKYILRWLPKENFPHIYKQYFSFFFTIQHQKMRKRFKEYLAFITIVWKNLDIPSTKRIYDKSCVPSLKIICWLSIGAATKLKPSDYISDSVHGIFTLFEGNATSNLSPMEWYIMKGFINSIANALHPFEFCGINNLTLIFCNIQID